MEKIELHNDYENRISVTGPEEAMNEMVAISQEPGTTQAIRALVADGRTSFATLQELKAALYAKATELKSKKIYIVVKPTISIDAVFSAALVTIVHPEAGIATFSPEVSLRGYYIGCAPKDGIDAINLSRTEEMSSFVRALHTFKDSLNLKPGAFESLVETRLVREIGRCDENPAPLNMDTPFYYMIFQFQRMWSEVWEGSNSSDLEHFSDAVKMVRLMLIRYVETANAYIDALNYTKEAIKNRPNRNYVIFEKIIMPSIIPEDSRNDLLFAIPSTDKGRWVLLNAIPSNELSFSESQIKAWMDSFPPITGITFMHPDPRTLVVEGAPDDNKVRQVVDHLIKCAAGEAKKIQAKRNASLS